MLTPEQKQLKLQGRYRAKTDLFWLGKEILGYEDLNERVHGPVCQFFVQKKPGLSIAQQDARKERLLLDPRGHFKTTLDTIDIVQWILNFPDIRILIMSGKVDVAKEMIKGVSAAFQECDKLARLFPELCGPDQGGATQFTSKGRTLTIRKEPTVMISSGESVKAGLHFDVIKGDDLVNEINTANREQIAKTINLWNYATPLLEPFGYRDLIGTRYAEDDLYGWAKENKKNLLTFERPVWTFKDEKVAEQVRLGKRKLEATDVDLLFPERFTFEWLNDQRVLDAYIFNCQYLNDPTPIDTATFSRDQIMSHIIPHAHIPHSGTVVQVWDIGTGTAASDYSCCATGLYDADGNLFILDLLVERFQPFELANAIVMQYKKWRPSKCGIEKNNGANMLAPTIDIISRQMGIYMNIEWFQITRSDDSKELRIKGLQPLLINNKLYFSAQIGLRTREEMIKQFTKFPKGRKDDAPDAIAHLLRYRSNIDIRSREQDDDDSSEIYYNDSSYGLGAGLVG